MPDSQQVTEKPLLRDTNLYVIFCVTLYRGNGRGQYQPPALPQMARVLQVSNEQIGLLITFFTVPGIFLTPLLAVLADRIGRKMILIPSLFIFGIRGTACAYATDFTWLLILRFVQGVGKGFAGRIEYHIDRRFLYGH
ncbi:MAG: MFS transporter [Balneolaceae bacterium]|nr:MFS transporter [Balneolaceae bacterium]